MSSSEGGKYVWGINMCVCVCVRVLAPTSLLIAFFHPAFVVSTFHRMHHFTVVYNFLHYHLSRLIFLFLTCRRRCLHSRLRSASSSASSSSFFTFHRLLLLLLLLLILL